MAARKTPARRPARSRAEVKNDFDLLARDIDREETDRATTETAKAERARVGAAVGGLTVETVVKRVSNLGLDLSRALSSIQEHLTQETQQLEDVRAAIRFAEEDLKNLYNIDTAATRLEHLVAEYKEQEKALSESIAATKQAWAEEKKRHELAVLERDAELAKSRQREQETYAYNEGLRRRNAETEFRLKQEIQNKQLDEAHEAKTKDWAQREESLAAQEKEVAQLRIQVSQFPDTLKKEVDAKVAIATNALKKDLTQEFALKQKDLETQLTIEKSKVEQLQRDKNALSEQIIQLTAKLEAAQNRVADVAAKAIEGASGQFAMQKVQETLATQSSGGNGSRKQ